MAENNPSIASSVALCLETFETFAKTLTCSPPEKGYGSFQSAAADCIGRFRVWSGNIGAHQRGKSSLDHRLRDASYIRIRVLRLLDNLNKLLIEGED